MVAKRSSPSIFSRLQAEDDLVGFGKVGTGQLAELQKESEATGGLSLDAAGCPFEL